MMNQPNMADVKDYFKNLQDIICSGLEIEDGKANFEEDNWIRPQGGGGITRVMQNGAVFEKAGVNFSYVKGKSLPKTASQDRSFLEGWEFEATGVSLVIHPQNPYVPTSHANVRFFKATKPGSEPVWWFGGGLDLTPYYGFEEDCVYWHKSAFDSCEIYGEDLYQKYKKNCDQYFYLKHREEPRGIGGLFFDDLYKPGFLKSFAFTQEIGDLFLKAYLPIVSRRKDTPYGERQKNFQRYRRGRYVEFNLLYDRGTAFGLQSGGAIESILMSLPPQADWVYKWHPDYGTEERELYDKFLVNKDWLHIEKCHNCNGLKQCHKENRLLA